MMSGGNEVSTPTEASGGTGVEASRSWWRNTTIETPVAFLLMSDGSIVPVPREGLPAKLIARIATTC
jgi:hypothetical protein